MATKTQEQRIKLEKNRLSRQFAKIDKKKRAAAEGLMERAAFMRVSLEDLEADLVTNGMTELFSQSPTQAPYERKRPAAEIYNAINANYQKIIRQLTDLLPKDDPQAKVPESDGFDSFVQGREDV